MKKNIYWLVTAVMMIALASRADAVPAKTAGFEEKQDTLKKDGIDPVCAMKVKAGNTRTIRFEEKLFGFCSESCKKKFVAEPRKYIKK